MKKNICKTMIFVLITLIWLLISTNVFATNEDIQIVKTDEGNIVYVKDMEKKDFKFATSNADEKLDPDSIELSYVNALQDDDENNIALIEDGVKFLYIKDEIDSKVIEIDLSSAITKNKIQEIEKTTNRIKTETISVSQKDEQVGEVKYEETVGGLKITDDNDSSYEYFISPKLPKEKYSDLKVLAEELNNDYQEKDMYSKIEFLKNLEKALNELISDVTWNKVSDMKILQPEDAQKGDEYVVLLKKTAKDGTTYDVKFMTSDRTETAPEKVEETTPVKSTAKLPVTGDSMVLFIILGIIIIALIIVFVRIKKMQKKDQK